MGGGDHGHGAPYKVPDWKSYKVQGVPELEHLQRRLAVLGLKDPWIRNEVWRFVDKTNHSVARVAARYTFRGFGYAVAALAITIFFDKIVNKGKGGHGHH